MKMMSYNRRYVKLIAFNFALLILFDAVSPFKMVFALTSGPASPEFSSFEPVATTDMVNVFSGDFTYNLPILNVPGPDNSGYPLSLSYHSGSSVDEEASWVGFGWTLNPGSINRMKRGLPDDFMGNDITHFNKTRPNFSISATEEYNLEVYSRDIGPSGKKTNGSSMFGINYSGTVRYNNYQGMSLSRTYGISVKGIASIGMTVRGTERTFSANVNVAAILSKYTMKKLGESVKLAKSAKLQERFDRLKSTSQQGFTKLYSNINNFSSTYGIYSMITAPSVSAVNKFEGVSYNYSFSAQLNFANVPVGFQMGYAANLTLQKNVEEQVNESYGFMYPNPEDLEPYSTKSISTDYFVEKGSTYSELDNFLGIPFNSADNFVLTGEGLGGGFRMYHDRVFSHSPYPMESVLEIKQLGIETMGGPNFGIGVDIGKGSNKLTANEWDFPGDITNLVPQTKVFRFNNDMGGSVNYSDNTNAETAQLVRSNEINILGFKDFEPSGITLIDNQNTTEWKKASSFIDYRINDDSEPFFNNSTSISNHLTEIRQNEKIDESLAEFSITNANGFNYLYGLPVYSKEEYNINLNVTPKISNENIRPYIVHENVDENNPANQNTYMGEYIKDPYATTYLLTQITSPEYIDMGYDGPDEKDFGGWTKFGYRKMYGSDSEKNQWYNWRFPYNGLYNAMNELSNLEDDMGSFSKGQKEMYFLKAIETKSHIAFFITSGTDGSAIFDEYIPEGISNRDDILSSLDGSDEARKDALGAATYASASPDSKNVNQVTAKLERIVLYSKGRLDKPVQTTYFEYDYSLVKDLPNSVNGNYPENLPDSDEKRLVSGKLTLKRLWTESEGIVKSRISPYVFTYAYQANYDQTIKDQLIYEDIVNYGTEHSDAAQNPDYLPQSLDMWGFNNYKGASRYNKMQPWVFQGEIDNLHFDPAAHQLKQIKLPSGGEIHVQYEQKDYAYVQDRIPMAMVSIKEYDDNEYKKNPRYTINLEDIGLKNTEKIKIEEYRDFLYNYFVDNGTKIYFKFLFGLNHEKPGLNTTKSEYLNGYADIADVQYIDNGSTAEIEIKIDAGDQGANAALDDHPRTLCYNFLNTQRAYKIDFIGNVTPYDTDILGNYDEYATNGWTVAKYLYDFAKKFIVQKGNGTIYKQPDKDLVGNEINKELSYLRIPMQKDKRGGGIRVKRLLMYDSGIESGDAALYGNEYVYKTKDGRSSGVACNEPALGREENALVTLLPRLKQSYYKQLVGGKDRKHAEGPIGESLLPAPSVGHSRVVVQNIHTGKTGTGFTVHEFHTTKDYPFDMIYTSDGNQKKDFDKTGKGVMMTNLHNKGFYNKRDKLKFNAIIFNYSVNKVWLSQGFRFIINNMNGQPKSVASYFGTFSQENNDQKYILSSKVEHDYFAPGEKVVIWDGLEDKSYKVPGKEVEIAIEQKKLRDETIDLTLELDISVSMGWLPILPMVMPTYNYSDKAVQTFATSKVLRYPTIKKAVRTYQDGIWSIQENLAFSPLTGAPILTRTIDEFDNQIDGAPFEGSYYSFSIPASSVYEEMGQKSINNTYSNQLTASAGNIVTYGINPLDISEPENIISASLTTYRNDWEWPINIITEYNFDETRSSELNQIYRPYENYIYKSEVTGSNLPSERIYSGGISPDYEVFDFENPEYNTSWQRTNTITTYSPNGNPLEERNILDIYSAVKYGYNKTMPVALAKNAKWTSIYFNDFEYDDVADIEFAHSGNKSHKVTGTSYSMIESLDVNDQLFHKGGIVKMWVKTNDDNAEISASFNDISTNFRKIAKSGNWKLYEAKINEWGITQVTDALDLNFVTSEDIWIDDIRFQPADALMITYVYDPATLRLITQFDDQHFGLYYQYNGNGKLVRKIIETERGMKTIQENQYNTPKTDRLVSETS
jgi:hypothetical protein